MTDARYAALTGALGLTVNDLAEIGGFSARFARDLVAGRRPFPQDVKDALDDIESDLSQIANEIVMGVMESSGPIIIFRSNGELRKNFKELTPRGCADGGFVGPYRIAAIEAERILLCRHVIRAELAFFDENE